MNKLPYSRFVIFLFVVALGLFITLTLFQYQEPFLTVFYSFFGNVTNNRSIELAVAEKSRESILILVWTPFFWDKYFVSDEFASNCSSEFSCIGTTNRSLIQEASVVLFHIRSMSWSDIPLRSERRPDQYYVFGLWESPFHTWSDLRSDGHRDFFNVTMTYRLDSDVFYPYGEFRRKSIGNTSMIDQTALSSLVAGKKKLLAWFVSNCGATSRRQDFVRELQTFVPVDVYGSCGPLKCDGSKLGVCHKLLTTDYKFYLSLENSFCRDYVTEKFFNILESAVVVPIVMERKIVLDTVRDNETARALNKSFIAVDDFPNTKNLVDYLKFLDLNRTEYIKYFDWHRNFEIQQNPGFSSRCQLCQIALKKQERKIGKIGDWWENEANCHVYKKRV